MFVSGVFTNECVEEALPLERLFEEVYETDPFHTKILHLLRDGVQESKEITLAECNDVGGGLQYHGMYYVPAHPALRLHLVQEHHDLPAAGHPGRAKTLDFLSRNFYWPKMRQYVDQYVRNYRTCFRTNAP